MTKKMLWMVVSGLMALSLVMAACGPAATTTTTTNPTTPTTPATPTTPGTPATQEPTQKEAVKPTGEEPKYGGTIVLSGGDITNFDPIRNPTGGTTINLVSQGPWAGDWAKGPAGGYGTSETDWAGQYDIWEHKAGQIAETTKWTVDEAKNEGTIIYQVRQGVHWQLNPASELSRKVGGRELTADDFAAYLNRTITDPNSYIYRTNIDLRAANITKTGPWEVTIRVPLDALITAVMRFGDSIQIMAPDTKDADMTKWQNSFGTGPFMVSSYVPGSTVILDRNPNYWMKNPAGPGKGDQLPYLDRFQYIILPDASTRQAAFRTAKVDQMSFNFETADQMRQTAKGFLESPTEPQLLSGAPESIDPPSDTPPFNDIRVRRALMLATDFYAINSGLTDGRGQILTWPFSKIRGYEALYLGLDDPEMPASVKELYTYSPDKAKQLLKEAGFPNGLKVTALVTSTQVDYYAVVKDMWAKVGIDLTLDIRDSSVKSTMLNRGDYTAGFADGGVAPVSVFHSTPTLTGTPSAPANTSRIFDPKVDAALKHMRLTIIREGMPAGMKEMKELLKYALDQAWAIPTPYVPGYVFWWPWIKNYSGETTVGYFEGSSWAQWVWQDAPLKKSMGY